MHVRSLAVTDFRSYPVAELELRPGVTTLVGRNGQGKTNLVEALVYLATLGSHRVAADAPLVRAGAPRAVIRGVVVRDERETRLEIEITPGKANRARVGGAPVPRARELLGTLRTVLFAPEDLAVVKGDPGERRRFLDDLLVARAPRYAAVRADYDRVLRQRNALLKSAAAARRSGSSLATLDVWDTHLAQAGAALLAGRHRVVAAITPLLSDGYAAVGGGSTAVSATYQTSLPTPGDTSTDVDELAALLMGGLQESRAAELDRGITLVGPHRDELLLTLGELPARGYASHGESWSFTLALRLAAYDLLRADGGEPVLVLDDVFAELDASRRTALATRMASAEQVLITAAVPDDVPAALAGDRFEIDAGQVRRAG